MLLRTASAKNRKKGGGAGTPEYIVGLSYQFLQAKIANSLKNELFYVVSRGFLEPTCYIKVF